MSELINYILSSSGTLAMPIAVYPGAAITGATVSDIVTDPEKQFNAQYEIHKRYETWIVQTAMDLSVEAEAFGSEIQLAEKEIPTVRGRLVTDKEQIDALTIPAAGERRTKVYLDTVRLLTKLDTKPFVLGGMIGPFSLAGRLFGVSESLELTMTEPDTMHLLIEKCTIFLTAYAEGFKQAGADGVFIAEPSAGLLSPRSLGLFSSEYIKRIHEAVKDDSFTPILHNCAAKINHLPAILESGVSLYHFGSPMDLPAALKSVPGTTVLCGNLDPAGIFLNSSEKEILIHTEALLRATSEHNNFVISSGCDVPPGVTMNKLDAFYKAVNNFGNKDQWL
jgi:uroporphyrinogen decarboxylase